MMKALKTLIVDDQPDTVQPFIDFINRPPSTWQSLYRFEPLKICETYEEALSELKTPNKDAPFEILFLDIDFGENRRKDGIDYLAALRRDQFDNLPILMLTVHIDQGHQSECLEKRCDGFITKSSDDLTEKRIGVIEHVIERSLKMAELRRQSLRPDGLRVKGNKEIHDIQLYGSCPQMRRLFWEIIRVSSQQTLWTGAQGPRVDVPNVVIRGETGTGKSSVARAIHLLSDRREGSYCEVVLTSIPETLIESALFGIEEGAASNVKAHRGFIEEANRGTLFLDEIGEIPLNIQVKLLQALRERTITRVGSTKPISVDFRLITATHQDLENRLKDGSFRADFYHRIAGKRLDLPRLTERFRDDNELNAMLDAELGKQQVKFILTPGARKALQAHPWPGNYAEFKSLIINLAGELMTFVDETLLKNRLIPSELGEKAPDLMGILAIDDAKLATKLFQKFYAELKFKKFGTQAKAASEIQIDAATFGRWLRGPEAESGHE